MKKEIKIISLTDLTRILIINALVKFNLIPPYDSEAWNAHKYDYESLYIHLLPPEKYEKTKGRLLSRLLASASTAKTPTAKMSLYRSIAELTGDDCNLLACSVQRSIESLAGLCTYKLATSFHDREIPPQLLIEVNKWREFHNTLPECFLWESANVDGPWTECVLVTALSEQLLLNESDKSKKSCLYALAVILQRDEIIENLNNEQININNLPKNIIKHYQKYLLDNNLNADIARAQCCTLM